MTTLPSLASKTLETAATATVIACPRCKSEVMSTFLFCTQCGYQVKKKQFLSITSSSKSNAKESLLVSNSAYGSPLFQEDIRKLPKKKKSAPSLDQPVDFSNLPKKVFEALSVTLENPSRSEERFEINNLLNSMEFSNLDVVERSYRELDWEKSKGCRKATQERFPPILEKKTKQNKFKTAYLSEIEPVTTHYEESVRRSTATPSTSNHGKRESQELFTEENADTVSEPKAWLWGSSIFSDSQAEVNTVEDNKASKGLPDLDSSSVLFWGNLSALSQPQEAEEEEEKTDILLKDRLKFPSTATDSYHDNHKIINSASPINDKGFEEGESSSKEIDWLSVDFPGYCEKYRDLKYTYNLVIGRLLMESYNEMKALLPSGEIDYRVNPTDLTEKETSQFGNMVLSSNELLQEAKDIVEIMIPEEIQKFHGSSSNQRHSIAKDIMTVLDTLAKREAISHEKYFHTKNRIEKQILSENEYIARTKNFILLKKLLDDNQELKTIEERTNEELERLGNYLKEFYEIESTVMNDLR
jgi:hypothetical protein